MVTDNLHKLRLGDCKVESDKWLATILIMVDIDDKLESCFNCSILVICIKIIYKYGKVLTLKKY